MHQLCLVSEQPMPNFLAAIEPSLGVNRVTLAVTGKMEDRATWLEEALHRHQIETDRLPIVIHTDFEGMWTTFAEWAEAHKGAVLNVTGGTKLMAIAAQDAFRSAGAPVFYVDLDTGRGIWIEGAVDEKAKTFQPSGRPKVQTAFSLNGFQVLTHAENYTADKGWLGFLDAMEARFDEWEPLLGTLNYRAEEAKKKTLWFGPLGGLPKGWDGFQAALEEAGLMGYRGVGVYFTSEEALKFCQGGWLEHYTFRILRQRFGLKQSYAWMNVEVLKEIRENGKVKKAKQELDNVAIVNGNLSLVECKTANLQDEKGDGMSRADAAVFKIAELTRTYGLSARGFVVSARKVREEDHDRAKVFGVRVLDNFKTLEQDLRQALRL